MGLQNSKIRQNHAAFAQPKTILHVIDALNYGGAQKLLVLLAQYTPADKYRTIICALQANNDIKAEIESKGVRVVCFNRMRPGILRFFHFLAYFYGNLRDLCRICRQEQVDILQCHLSDAEFLGILAGRLCGIRRILTTVHYPDLLPQRSRTDLRNRLRVLVTKRLYGWVDFIIAVSEEVARRIEAVFEPDATKIRVMVNRIAVGSFADRAVSRPTSESLGIARHQRVLTAVGRLMPPKGHVHLVRAMAQLAPRFEGLRLFLAGDGDLRPALEDECRRLGLEDCIDFLGSRDDVADILSVSDIFVLPSLWEGTSLALLEAMAAAKPIVATAIAGNMTVLAHQKNGYLVAPGDSRALAQGIAFLLDNPDVAAQYAKNAQQTVLRRFDIRRSIEELEALWA